MTLLYDQLTCRNGHVFTQQTFKENHQECPNCGSKVVKWSKAPRYVIDEHFHTSHGRVPNVRMDSKDSGGIHLWVIGEYISQVGDGKKSISVHLSREQAILLAQEILWRIAETFKQQVEIVIRNTNSWK